MADISYFEAWQMWMNGRSTLGNDLFGVPMIWLGRSGKIAAFVGGLAVVLDLVGTERLRYGPMILRTVAVTFVGAIVAVVLTYVGIILAYIGSGSVFIVLILIRPLFAGWFRVMDRVRAWRLRLTPEELGDRSRWVCFVLVVIGFHFDLLAS